MKPGAVFVDVAVDQGGCGETTKVTYHDDPIFVEDGVVHYCVGNMPGAVPYTSTIALTNATQSYGLQIAAAGLEEACRKNSVMYSSINTYDGMITCSTCQAGRCAVWYGKWAVRKPRTTFAPPFPEYRRGFRKTAGSPRGYRHTDLPLYREMPERRSPAWITRRRCWSGQNPGRGTCPCALSAGGCGGAALWEQQLRHRALAQRVSCVFG